MYGCCLNNGIALKYKNFVKKIKYFGIAKLPFHSPLHVPPLYVAELILEHNTYWAWLCPRQINLKS